MENNDKNLKKLRIIHWIQEMVRRCIQYMIGIFIFDCPGLSWIRIWGYSLICKISSNTVISSKVLFYTPHGLSKAKVHIGRGVRISENVRIDCSAPVIVSDNVWISENVMILGHEHNIYGKKFKDSKDIIVTKGIRIYEDAWIGTNAIILPQVNFIGRGSVIGAGSVVTKDIKDYEIVAGNPAIKIGSR